MNIRERETRLLNTVSNIMNELGDSSIYSHVLHQTVRMHAAKLHHYADHWVIVYVRNALSNKIIATETIDTREPAKPQIEALVQRYADRNVPVLITHE